MTQMGQASFGRRLELTPGGDMGVSGLVRDHRELEVWKRGHRLALDIYKITRSFPKDEVYGLSAQLRRAAVAISANLSEGGARHSRKEYVQFCYIARGSASEVNYLLIVARDLGYLLPADYDRLSMTCEEISKMLTTLIKSLQSA